MISLFLPYMVHHTRLFNFTSYHCFSMFFKSYFHWREGLAFVYFPTITRDRIYTQFLVMLNSVGGLTRKRYHRRVEPLVNIVLMSYGLTYPLDPFGYAFDIGQTYCGEFSTLTFFQSWFLRDDNVVFFWIIIFQIYFVLSWYLFCGAGVSIISIISKLLFNSVSGLLLSSI